LQVKAYFRLGTAQYSSKNYTAAVTSFQRSIQLKKDSRGEPEAIVLRCLAEAIIDKATKQERMQKRYKTSMQDRDEKRI
jgi:TolA-binding protein